MERKERTPLQTRKHRLRNQYYILSAIKYTLLFIPLLAVIIYNREDYFTYKDGISVSIGFILALVTFILIMKHQMLIFKGVWKFVIIFALCYLLRVVIYDAVEISAAILIGYFVSMWFTKPIVRAKALLIEIDKADINATALSETTLNVKQN